MERCDWCGEVHDPDCGRHRVGCFYGGPEGEGFWFAVHGCGLDHSGDIPPLWGTVEGARDAWNHLTVAGLRTNSEQ